MYLCMYNELTNYYIQYNTPPPHIAHFPVISLPQSPGEIRIASHRTALHRTASCCAALKGKRKENGRRVPEMGPWDFDFEEGGVWRMGREGGGWLKTVRLFSSSSLALALALRRPHDDKNCNPRIIDIPPHNFCISHTSLPLQQTQERQG